MSRDGKFSQAEMSKVVEKMQFQSVESLLYTLGFLATNQALFFSKNTLGSLVLIKFLMSSLANKVAQFCLRRVERTQQREEKQLDCWDKMLQKNDLCRKSFF